MKYKSFKARILVDGTQLSEYDTTTTDAQGVPCISCWIPSEAGKTFVIKCVDAQAERPPSSWRFYVDGVRVSKKVLEATDDQAGVTLRDVRADGARRRLLMFSSLSTTDDDAAEGLSSAALGEIMVTVLPIRVRARATGHTKGAVHLTEGTIHERSKKAGAHVVGFGPISNRPNSSTTLTEVIGPPFVKFVFRYRPLALLQAQGIAPPPVINTHTQDTLEVKDEVPDDNELHGRLDRMEEQMARISSRSRSIVKPEPIHVSLSASNEVIDLVSD